MQDNASCHTAKITLDTLAEAGVTVMPWPAKSADLNPIETLWGKMKQKIDVDIFADTEELEAKVLEVWNSITMEEINDIVRSFHYRVHKMIDRKGDDCQVKRCYLAPPPENSAN